MRLRQDLPSPVDRPAGMWIELTRFIQSRSHPVVISTNSDRIHATNLIDCFYWVWTITNDVAAAEYRIVMRLFRTLDASFKRFQVGMDVTQDEITHGV